MLRVLWGSGKFTAYNQVYAVSIIILYYANNWTGKNAFAMECLFQAQSHNLTE